jgi:hypothetical protein
MAGINQSMDSTSENDKSNYFPFALIRREKVKLGMELARDLNYPDAKIIKILSLYFTEKFLHEEQDSV